jgi:hypothetical protein
LADESAFLGLGSLDRVGGWRPDFSSRPLGELGAAIAPRRDTSLRTTALPAGRRFTVTARTTGDDVTVRAIFRSPLDDYESVPVGKTNGRHTVVLRGRIPFLHASLAQVELDLMNGGRNSANAGTGVQPAAKGILTFGTPRVNGRPVPAAFASWTGTGGISGTAARLGYVLTPDRTGRFRARQPTDGSLLRVLATPRVAAAAGPHGVIPLEIEGEQIPGRIVGIIERFPSVVGDRRRRSRDVDNVDTRSPGLGDRRRLNSAPAKRAPAHGRVAGRHACGPAERSTRTERSSLAGTAAVALLLHCSTAALGRRRRARRLRRLRPRSSRRLPRRQFART